MKGWLDSAAAADFFAAMGTGLLKFNLFLHFPASTPIIFFEGLPGFEPAQDLAFNASQAASQ